MVGSARRNQQTQTGGCWRAMLGCLGHLPGQWPRGEALQQKSADDPRNTYFTPFARALRAGGRRSL